jgi:PAS domain S-box-containing protein
MVVGMVSITPSDNPATASHKGSPDGQARLVIVGEPTAAERVISALGEAGTTLALKVVDTEAAFVRELRDFAPDLVLAGSISGYSARSALEFTRSAHPEIPVVVLGCQAASEDALALLQGALAMLRAGARDYVHTSDLTRLVPVVLAAARSAHDRRERERADAVLLRSEVRYRRLFESARDGILIVDADQGLIVDANPFMIDLLGYSYDEYLTKHLWDIDAFSDVVASRSAFEKLRRNGCIRYEHLPLRTIDGRMMDAEFVSNVYAEGDHEIIQCNIRDVTERKLTERKLFQAQKMAAVGVLTGGIAHNINNLLSIIVMSIEMLRGRTAEDKQCQEHTGAAIEAAMRGAELIRQLLAFARQQPLQPQLINVNQLVSRIVATLRPLLGEGVEVSLHLANEAVWPVLTDTVQLETSIVNLAVNAREAMTHGGRLSISTRNLHLGEDAQLIDPIAVPGDYVEVAMSDTGTGMAAHVMQQIFEPFFSTKALADKPGTGLGLSTVYGFIKQSGGNIGVESKLDVGTTFRLYLPRAQKTESLAKDPAPQIAERGHETVLVVEDTAGVREVVVSQLGLLGYHVLQSEDAVTALKSLAENRIDLLFSDIILTGELDGVALARNALARWPGLRVLLTTGFGRPAGRGDTYGLHVLEKPYRATELSRAVRDALDADARSTQ